METINYAVCDDEEIILDAVFDRVRTIFKRSGIMAIGQKFRSPKALQSYILKPDNREELNLVFLDIDMPELNGIELGKAIKEHNKKIEIIFVSNPNNSKVGGVRPSGTPASRGEVPPRAVRAPWRRAATAFTAP